MKHPVIAATKAIVLCCIVAGQVLASTDKTDLEADLEFTIRPSTTATRPADFSGSYLPLSDGGVIDFAGWMAQKYGLSDWVSDAALLDQATGRAALTVYGLSRVDPEDFVEDAYNFKPQLPGCGLVTRLLWGQSKCAPDWQAQADQLVGVGVAAPQMVGVMDFNPFTAITPVEMELGRLRFGAPNAVLSMVP